MGFFGKNKKEQAAEDAAREALSHNELLDAMVARIVHCGVLEEGDEPAP